MNLKKKLLVFTLSIVTITSSSVFAAGKLPKEASNTKIDIYINNQIKAIPDTYGKAYLDKTNDRVMVPIRYITEELGAYIQFYTEAQTNKQGILIGGVGTKLIKMNIGEKQATFHENSGKEVIETDAAPILYDGRTYVPIRFISEAMGLKVNWKDNNVYIEGSFKNKPKDTDKNIEKNTDENKSSNASINSLDELFKNTDKNDREDKSLVGEKSNLYM